MGHPLGQDGPPGSTHFNNRTEKRKHVLEYAPFPGNCAYLAEKLKEFGYQVDANVGGGVLGILDSGKPGNHFVLRADTDALAFYIDGEMTDYHGYCHDGHMTILLTAAKSIARQESKVESFILSFNRVNSAIAAADMVVMANIMGGTGQTEVLAQHCRCNAEPTLVLSGSTVSASVGSAVSLRGYTEFGVRKSPVKVSGEQDSILYKPGELTSY